jgi:hypothetical protein
MRILWIEDFGEARNSESYVLAIFKDLLGEKVLDNHWDSDEIKLKRDPQALLSFCQQHSTTHEAILCRHIHDFEQVMTEYILLQDIDVVLIDINLNSGIDPAKPIPTGYRHEEGGFYIYNLLIREGFPDCNICFLTGEKKSTLIPFEQRCEQIFMPKPQSFEKTDSEFAKFRKWLNDKELDNYLTLRRGIIEGCQYIRSLLNPDMIEFDKFLPIDNSIPTPNPKSFVNNLLDYLETLQNLLPLRKPSNLQRFYKLFIRNLSLEWDTAYHPDNLPRCDKMDRDCFQSRIFKYSCGWIMKCARNWAAHTTVFDNLSESEVAFLFIVSMRAMFKLSQTPEKYERLLLNLFDKVDSIEMQNKIGTTPMNTLLPLSRTYLEAKNQIFQSNTNDALHFNSLLNNLVNNQVEFDYVTGLFQIFWHGLSPVRLYERGTTIDNNKNVVFKYSFCLNDYGKKDNGFLFELARSIYKRSFEFEK